jgi:hypothetical protein
MQVVYKIIQSEYNCIIKPTIETKNFYETL